MTPLTGTLACPGTAEDSTGTPTGSRHGTGGHRGILTPYAKSPTPKKIGRRNEENILT